MSRIKNFVMGQVTFRVVGMPQECLNKLRKFHITNIQIDCDAIIFNASLNYLTAIKNLINNFEFEIKENYNLFRGLNFLLNHFVLVLAIIVASISFLVSDMGIYDIKVQCDDTALTQTIYQYLNNLGIKKFTWKNKLQHLNLASDLIQNFNQIAHANVTISGNTLLVNLVTATNEHSEIKTNYYAQYDAVIKEITAYSGTVLVTVGDVVKKGDLLVANAYPHSVVAIGEVAFNYGDKISRLDIWII